MPSRRRGFAMENVVVITWDAPSIRSVYTARQMWDVPVSEQTGWRTSLTAVADKNRQLHDRTSTWTVTSETLLLRTFRGKVESVPVLAPFQQETSSTHRAHADNQDPNSLLPSNTSPSPLLLATCYLQSLLSLTFRQRNTFCGCHPKAGISGLSACWGKTHDTQRPTRNNKDRNLTAGR